MLGAKARGLVGFAAMAGSVLGTALQLQQPALWKWAAYAGLMAGALAAWLALQSLRRPVRTWPVGVHALLPKAQFLVEAMGVEIAVGRPESHRHAPAFAGVHGAGRVGRTDSAP